MKIPKTQRGKVLFDCPWNGHEYDPDFLLVNRTAQNLLGRLCVKCDCLVYSRVAMSGVLGPDGAEITREVKVATPETSETPETPASEPQADGGGE